MKHNRTPDNDDMARLIATSFDALPDPDEERLEAVRTRLGLQLKRPRHYIYGKRWLWLFLLLGGTVAAAWWLNDTLIANEKEQSSVDISPSISTGSAEDVHDDADNRQAAEVNDTERNPGHAKDSPIIYQREQ